MNRAAVKFDALLDAFEFVSFGQPSEHEEHLCVETGTIHFHTEYGDNEKPLPDDLDDSSKYIAIPHKNDLNLGRSLVLRYTREFLPDEMGKIQEIFSHAGAYARFKEMLESRGKIQHWYEYEATAQRQALREWCVDNGIKIDD